MKLPRLLLQRGRHRRVLAGHRWVYSNEIEPSLSDTPEAGDLVEVRAVDGHLLGLGLFHPNSLVAVRLLGPGEAPEAIDTAFLAGQLSAARDRRRRAYGEVGVTPPAAYRLCHAEADGLPGVTIDVFADVAVVQITCLGMDRRREALLDALQQVLAPRAIVARGDTPWRVQEGLPEERGVVRGERPAETVFHEHGLAFAVDVLEGQKTGWFLDQRDHRAAIRPYAAGARVLDLFSYEGGFALNALAAGARSVRALDASARALERLTLHAERNGLADRLFTEKADLMERVGGDAPGGEPLDLVILDPPSFTRSRKAVPAARKAYARLNAAALRWLAPGGVLATASCSHHVFEETFLEILQEAAQAEGRTLRVLYRGFQPADHPVLLAMPETRYLKFFLVQRD
jgi:23S rRNA (cytosine1962-C5)-methyltransferase